MTLRRQKLLARLLLAAGVLLGLAWLAHLNFARKISTDVLDLIPRDERSPELALVRGLASDEQARVALLALRVPAMAGESESARTQRLAQAAQAMVGALRQSPAFAEAVRRLEFRRSATQRVEILIGATQTGMLFTPDEERRFFR